MLVKNDTIIGSFEIDVCGIELANKRKQTHRRKSEISFLKYTASLALIAEATLQKRKMAMVLMGKQSARCAYNLPQTNLFYAKITIPPPPDSSRQMVSKYIYCQCLLKVEFCVLKPNILIKYYCVGRGPLRSPRGLRR